MKLITIDGFATLVPEGKINDYFVVSKFLKTAQSQAEKLELTLLGIVHSPKVKEGEGYAKPREQILGSAAWGGFGDLNIIMNFESASDPENPNRLVTVAPRDGAEYVLRYQNVKGKLVPVEDIIEGEYFGLMYSWLGEIPPDRDLLTREILDTAEGMTMTRRTGERWIGEAIERGYLLKIKHGCYRAAGRA